MRFSTVMMVFAAILCVAGCKYDKAAKGMQDDSAADIGQGSDIENQGSGSVGDINEGKFEDMYTRCTDVEFAPVYFGFDSNVIPQGEFAKADAVVSHLNSKSDRVVVIEGNCDERGSNEYNMTLGDERSITVRNYLVQSGISADRIQTRSYGEEKPAVEGSDESAWSKNRRGEFVIFQK